MGIVFSVYRMDVEYYDEPDVFPYDFDSWRQSWCHKCELNMDDPDKGFFCEVVWELSINGWSRSFKWANKEIVCTDFQRDRNVQ